MAPAYFAEAHCQAFISYHTDKYFTLSKKCGWSSSEDAIKWRRPPFSFCVMTPAGEGDNIVINERRVSSSSKSQRRRHRQQASRYAFRLMANDSEAAHRLLIFRRWANGDSVLLTMLLKLNINYHTA